VNIDRLLNAFARMANFPLKLLFLPSFTNPAFLVRKNLGVPVHIMLREKITAVFNWRV
jgi:hypothetical protein